MSSILNSSCYESLLDCTDCLSMGHASLMPKQKSQPQLAFYSSKLCQVQEILQSLNSSITECTFKSQKLAKSNTRMREENKQLKQKILQIEGTQKKKIFELVTPSNTSLRTQATDWFLSKEASFSESSCSSNDSIVLLNNQVKEIKEMKTVNKSRGYHNAKISASLRNTSNLEQFFQDIKRKISFGSWGSVYKSPIEEEITYLPRNSGKKTFLSTALLADLPTIRF